MVAMTKRGFRGGLHVAGPEGEGPFDPVDLDRQDHAARDLVVANDRADEIAPGPVGRDEDGMVIPSENPQPVVGSHQGHGASPISRDGSMQAAPLPFQTFDCY